MKEFQQDIERFNTLLWWTVLLIWPILRGIIVVDIIYMICCMNGVGGSIWLLFKLQHQACCAQDITDLNPTLYQVLFIGSPCTVISVLGPPLPTHKDRKWDPWRILFCIDFNDVLHTGSQTQSLGRVRSWGKISSTVSKM